MFFPVYYVSLGNASIGRARRPWLTHTHHGLSVDIMFDARSLVSGTDLHLSDAVLLSLIISWDEF